MRLINEKGKDLIKQFEGLRLTAYKDQVGVWTIGYGHTGAEVGSDDVITQDQADYYLDSDLIKAETDVESLVKCELTDNQFASLVSFTFNLGAGALKSSTLLKKLNNNDYTGASNEFVKWDKIHKNGELVEDPGILRRRLAEHDLFLEV